MLHDAMKTVRETVFPFSLKKNKILFLFKKKKKKLGFSQPCSTTTCNVTVIHDESAVGLVETY